MKNELDRIRKSKESQVSSAEAERDKYRAKSEKQAVPAVAEQMQGPPEEK